MYFRGNKVYINEYLYYSIFQVKKRIVYAPCEQLKKMQKSFINLIKKMYPLKMSIESSARPHTNKKWVLKMDIKDFFGSVPACEIEKVMAKVCENLYLSNVNYYISLVTLDDKLPIGAPTSPYLANACFFELDRRIKNISNILDVDYSRYMDDLTFSSDFKPILNVVEERVRNLLNQNGYKLNEKKLKYVSQNKRQEVLGIIVNNRKPTISKELKRRVRAMIHRSVASKSCSQEISLRNRAWSQSNEDKLNGYLSYIKQVDWECFRRLKEYKRRLFYKYILN